MCVCVCTYVQFEKTKQTGFYMLLDIEAHTLFLLLHLTLSLGTTHSMVMVNLTILRQC